MSRQMMEVRISGKLTFNFIITPTSTIGDIKTELRKKLNKDPDTLSVKFWINKKKALDVFGTKKYDKVTLEKRWTEIASPVIDIEKEEKKAKEKIPVKTPLRPITKPSTKPPTNTLKPLASLQSKKFDKPKKYKIMGSGGVVHKVKHDGEKVYIKKLNLEVDTDEETNSNKTEKKSKYVLAYSFPVKDAIVAINSETELADGSSLLLHKTVLQYVFVGPEIFKFTALAPMKRLYISDDRTWKSYAVDEASNIYLFDEGVIVRNITPHIGLAEMLTYYDTNMVISGPEGEENRQKLSQQFRDIDRYYTEPQGEDMKDDFDSQDSELELVHAEEKKQGSLDYYYIDNGIKYFRNILEYKKAPYQKALVMNSNGIVTKFSKEDYEKLMKEYGKIHGFSFIDEVLM